MAALWPWGHYSSRTYLLLLRKQIFLHHRTLMKLAEKTIITTQQQQQQQQDDSNIFVESSSEIWEKLFSTNSMGKKNGNVSTGVHHEDDPLDSHMIEDIVVVQSENTASSLVDIITIKKRHDELWENGNFSANESSCHAKEIRVFKENELDLVELELSTTTNISQEISSEHSVVNFSHCVNKHNSSPQWTNYRNKPEPQPTGKPTREQILLLHQKLSEELPRVLNQKHDYRIYSPDICFENAILGITSSGLTNYMLQVNMSKLFIQTYCINASMEVLNLTAHIDESTIQARWRVKYLPLYCILIFNSENKYRYFDAFSTFTVGNHGLIVRHKLDKLMPDDSGVKDRVPTLIQKLMSMFVPAKRQTTTV